MDMFDFVRRAARTPALFLDPATGNAAWPRRRALTDRLAYLALAATALWRDAGGRGRRAALGPCRHVGLAASRRCAAPMLDLGENPYPVRLVRPPVAPLSAMAQLGRQIFFDASLSSSGKLACASCHSPAHAYGPPGDAAGRCGGPELTRQGVRAVPSLMYLERQPQFQHRAGQRGERDRQSDADWPRGPRRRGAREDRAGHARRRLPTWCRRAGCSGTAGPTRCRIRRWARC